MSVAAASDLATEPLLGLLAALGSGLLIGLERERRKGHGHRREPAGIRTFTLVALAGALAELLALPGLVVAGAAAVALLAGVAYLRSSRYDPGLTTELALLVTYLIGVLCLRQPQLGAPAAVVLTALLAARSRLHRFATELLREDELHDLLLLAALSLVVLPLMPAEPLPWLAGMKAQWLMGLVVMLLAMQAAGHLALRVLGPRAGLALAGLLSGLVSSTATIAAMGARARAEPALRQACAAGAVLSSAATWLQAQALLLVLAPRVSASALAVTMSGAAVAMLMGALLTRRAESATGQTPATHGGPLRLREAMLLALVLSAVTLLVSWAQARFGASGLFVAVALAALADAHAPIASLAALQASAQIDTDRLLQGLLLAVGFNSLSRSLTAVLAGGWHFARPVIAALAVSWLLAATTGFAILPALL